MGEKFRPYAFDVSFEALIKAVDFQQQHKKEDLSLFDCVGYIFSKEKNYRFVTGDKMFKDRENVEFIQK